MDAPLPKKASKNDSVKPQDTTSEDSELFDSSQVEEIKEGMNKKSHSDKRENWLEKKQGKSTNSIVNDAQGGAEETINGDVRRELRKSNTNSSAEFFNLE